MKLTHEDYDQLSVMSLRGEFTADGVDEFRRVSLERMAGEVRDFVLDASQLEFVDSKAIETLLWLQEQAGERLGQVRLAAVTDNVKKILEITRLASRFDAHPDVDAAIKSLR